MQGIEHLFSELVLDWVYNVVLKWKKQQLKYFNLKKILLHVTLQQFSRQKAYPCSDTRRVNFTYLITVVTKWVISIFSCSYANDLY
jgi:hypothetical protein